MKANFLGDTRAELDHEMLTAAFYESPDYLSIIGSRDKTVVVGRRGSGKSALVYKLSKVWNEGEQSKVVMVLPEDHHMLALKPFAWISCTTFTQKKAVAKIVWRYALFLELAESLADHFRFKNKQGADVLDVHLRRWRKYGATCLDRLVALIDDIKNWPTGGNLNIG